MSVELTVGLPVYNGARYLEVALDALLAQTYRDFRLLVSDNASTDATPEILARYAARDDRIEIVRQPRNIGGGANFDYLLTHSQTPYFMMAAHDDAFAPTAIERCLDGLRRDEDAVLYCADVAFIHEEGQPVKLVRNLDTAGMDRPERAHALLTRFGWYAAYGVVRRERWLETRPFTGRYGADVVNTMQLLMMGQVRSVPEPLFFYRIPATWKKSAAEQQLVIDHSSPVASRPYTTMMGDIVARVRRSGLHTEETDRIVETIFRTVAFENHRLRQEILSENGIAIDLSDQLATYRAIRTTLDIDVEGWPT